MTTVTYETLEGPDTIREVTHADLNAQGTMLVVHYEPGDATYKARIPVNRVIRIDETLDD